MNFRGRHLIFGTSFNFRFRHQKGAPGWQKFCKGTKGLCRNVWIWTKILSPNTRYFVAILRFVTIYAFFKLKVPFVQTQTKDSFLTFRLRRKTTPFVHTQTKDNFPSSILREKTTSFRPDSEHSFVWTQTTKCSFASKVKRHFLF